MKTNFHDHRTRVVLKVCGLVMGLALLAVLAVAQQSSLGVMRDFSVPDFHDPPHESQLRWLFKGAEARPQAGGLIVVRQITLEQFQPTGKREMLIESPECVFNSGLREASSTNTIRMQLQDGRFTLAGEGFHWQATNSLLVISNRVQTTLRGGWLASGDEPAPGASHAVGDAQVDAEQFTYDHRSMLAAYRRNVRVVSTNLNLASELLTFKLPEQGVGTVESLVAEENVAIGFGELRATGGKAVYTPGDGLMRLTGDPAWQADTREGRGDELLLDTASLRMQVNGGASLKLPVSGSGFIPQRADAVETTAETNRFVTLTAERYELQTNRASFTGGVRAVERAGEQVRASLTCGSLRSTFGASNQVQDFIAEQDVVLEQDERRLTGQRMNYDGDKGVAQLTGQPTWRDGERSGAGEVLLANLAGDQFIVRGGASLTMPGANDDQLLGALAIRPDSTRDGSAKTNAAPATPVKITCEEYELSPERAVFRGAVRVDDAKMQLTCDLLTVRLAPGGTNVLDIVADRNVVMSLVETNGQLTTATCARAVYTAATGQIEFSSQPTVRRPDGSWFVAERIVMDRATGNLSAWGSYRGSLASPGGETNAPALLFERRPQRRQPRTSSP